jgi:hypothetical protein
MGGAAADGADSESEAEGGRMTLVDRFIAWAKERAGIVQPVVTFGGQPLFDRYEFLRYDEYSDGWWDEHKARCKCHWCPAQDRRPRALPWWLPLNAFLHHWRLGANTPEEFHDHPRWSVTIVLKGRILERTPWGVNQLRPGSVVIRSRKYIHAFEIPEGAGEVWTLFIVGRRKHRQNQYDVKAK